MISIKSMIAGACVLAAVATNANASNIVMKLKCGEVTIKTFDTLTPAHVKQISTLANQGFYDGIIFHRVISGFMAQTGDPTGTGTGRSKLPNIKAEFNNVPFDRGIVGMARSSQPNSANSQFFIMFAKGYFLNGKYTAWGKVTKGMDCIDKINKGEPPANPDKIIKMRVAK
jgi:peptidylprolyl isomerase